MAVELKPIKGFLKKKKLLERVPKDLLPLAESPVPWTGYLAFDEKDELVGACAFKDVPDKYHQVEIAYMTFPEFERHGYATEMARLLVEIASSTGEIKAVLAHTLRKENVSAWICKRVGFNCKGEVNDPEDGLVWRWVMPL